MEKWENAQSRPSHSVVRPSARVHALPTSMTHNGGRPHRPYLPPHCSLSSVPPPLVYSPCAHLEQKTIRPHFCFSIWGTHSCVSYTTESQPELSSEASASRVRTRNAVPQFVLHVDSNSSALMSSMLPFLPSILLVTPELLNSTSTAPIFSTTSEWRARAPSYVERSA
jgi:hypothetical protein